MGRNRLLRGLGQFALHRESGLEGCLPDRNSSAVDLSGQSLVRQVLEVAPNRHVGDAEQLREVGNLDAALVTKRRQNSVLTLLC